MALTPEQLVALSITERVNSCISLVSILFILVTYWWFPLFNKPINRLIFFATWANLGVCVASLISLDGPRAGAAAPLCKVQAFLVQMFLGVDAYWALCMAINVYLVFFRGFSVPRLRALDLRYLVACYGLAFVPALAFIFVASPNPIYGDATLWCWISPAWDYLRLVILYAIVWLALLLSLVVYMRAARVVWRQRRQLPGYLNPWNETPFAGVVTTEISVTTEAGPPVVCARPIPHPADAADAAIAADLATLTHTRSLSLGAAGLPTTATVMDEKAAAYTVRVEGVPAHATTGSAGGVGALNLRGLTRAAAASAAHAEAWLYARAAFLFFGALALTWLPASANRVHGLLRPGEPLFPLHFASASVFPLQGFWNAVVYVWTSRAACRDLWARLVRRCRGGRGDDDESGVGGAVIGTAAGARAASRPLSVAPPLRGDLAPLRASSSFGSVAAAKDVEAAGVWEERHGAKIWKASSPW